jgi:hypothetical protein
MHCELLLKIGRCSSVAVATAADVDDDDGGGDDDSCLSLCLAEIASQLAVSASRAAPECPPRSPTDAAVGPRNAHDPSLAGQIPVETKSVKTTRPNLRIQQRNYLPRKS